MGIAHRLALICALLLIGTSTSAGPAAARPAAAGPGPRFGAVESYRAAAAAGGAGVDYQRISFLWSGLQPSGPQDWNAFYLPDDLIRSELSAGREIVGLLMSPPAWANGTGKGSDPPNGLYAGVDDPANLWAAYVRR